MKTQQNRRNFLQKTALLTAGIFSAKFVDARSVTSKKSIGTPDASNETLESIHNLHTTHGNFSEKEIPENEIEQIKQACIQAANASNMQSYSIVEIKDKALMGKVCQYVGSTLLLFCVDHNRLIASAKSLGYNYQPGNITAFITSSINSSFAAQTAVIAARSLGIDALTTNGIHRGEIDRHWDLLNLPEKYCIPLIAVVLGYADSKPDHKTGRLNGPEIFHSTTYHNPTAEELEKITATYDDPERHMSIGFGKNYKEKGHEHYLDWLFKDWLGVNNEPSKEESPLLVQLKKRGFIETN